MNKQNDLMKRINEKQKDFSKGQKLLANFITHNYDKAVFLTAAKLGGIVGVSESTVVRFAIELGYDGYPKLQRALEELVKTKLNSVQRMEVTSDRMNKQHVLKSVLQSDLDKVKATLEELDPATFDDAVNMILRAKTIYIIGVRSCAALASFLGFYFNLLFDNVKLIHTNSVSEMFEQIHRIGQDDVMIGISFPRYSKRAVKAVEYAHNRGSKIITLTDSILSPTAQFADCTLIARSDMASLVDSLVAPLSVINALIVAISMRKQTEVIDTLQTLENIWEEYEVYEKEDDLVGAYNLEQKSKLL